MTDLLTTEEAAQALGWSYDYARKRLSAMQPAKTIGKRMKLWSPEQLSALKTGLVLAESTKPVAKKQPKVRKSGESSVQKFLRTGGDTDVIEEPNSPYSDSQQ